jgi:hypothetical protein
LTGGSKLIAAGNSPDLNMIEPCWYHMKLATTEKGPPTNRKEAIRRWIKDWHAIEQQKIQEWILRIIHHVQEVIRLDGDNNYHESKQKFYKAQSVAAKLKKEADATEMDAIAAEAALAADSDEYGDSWFNEEPDSEA